LWWWTQENNGKNPIVWFVRKIFGNMRGSFFQLKHWDVFDNVLNVMLSSLNNTTHLEAMNRQI